MYKIRFLLLIISFIVNFSSLFSQTLPGWCEKVNYDKEFIANEHNRTQGVSYLLSDVQVNLVKEEVYTRLSLKITEENGLRQASSLVMTYDSTYQDAKFLMIKIIRSGKVINVLKNQKPELIRRERSLEYGLIDGILTSYIEVNDLRVGDILDYSYVVKGFNPIIKGFYLFNQNTSFTVPIGKIHICYITDGSNNSEFQLKNGAPKPQIKKGNNSIRYIWEINNPEVISFEQDIPSWYNPIPSILFSAKTTWECLANQILKLFTSKEEFSDEYKALLDTIINKSPEKEKQARYAIQYVQNNIHYLGNEYGIYSYKPRHPNTILQKKSGDCKEKSWLLTCLLNDIGYEAYPVLVNTVQGHVLDEQPVSMGAFNHCVNCLIIEEDTIFVDPTITNQGGGMKNLFFPNYENGLILKRGTSALTPIPLQNQGTTTIDETFSSDDLQGLAYLNVKTEMRGGNADFQRALLKNMSFKDIQSEYLKFYATLYLKIDTVRLLSFEDNIEDNIVTLEQSYSIKNFWKVSDTLKNEDVTANFQAQTIQNLLRREIYPTRKSPVAIAYPIDIKQTTIVNLPADWTVENENETITGDGYNFIRTVSYDNRKLRLEYHYVTTQSYIDKTQYADFIDQNGRIFNKLNYALWHYGSTIIEKNKERPHPFFIVFIVLIIGLCSMFAFQAFKYDPMVDVKYVNNKQSIGGWLLVPAIGIIVWTAFMLVAFLLKINWGINSWLYPSISNHTSIKLASRFIMLFGILFMTIFGMLNSILLLLRRSSFPKMMIYYYLTFALFTLVVSTLIFVIQKEGAIFFMNVWPFINCAIWIPYFIKSERVKNTFTRRLRINTIKTQDERVTEVEM
nr:DUF3857 domain-containing protein [uncultured Carboxylicivirga sp.]